jgi:hypothetical protein
MCLGVGVGDIIKLTEHAWALYKGYKDSSADFAQLATELQSLYVVLAETTDFLRENEDDVDTSRRNRLSMLHDGCCDVLRDMQALHARYESLGTQQQRTWDRMRFGMKDLTELRGRLVSCTTLLTAWNVAVIKYVSLFREAYPFSELMCALVRQRRASTRDSTSSLPRFAPDCAKGPS